MPDVFVSYSRKDRDFVLSLHARLTRDAHDTWVDWEDIPATSQWWTEIQKGIDSADNFVFVISPDSVRSKVCRDEIDYAVESNKRIIPILYRSIDASELQGQVHPSVSSHNWLYFDDMTKFDEAYQRLIQSIESGLQHIQEHTRLLIRAREWENGDKKAALLLDRRNLRIAKQWLKASESREPKPTDLHIAFIERSHQVRQRESLSRSAFGIVGLAIVGAIIILAGLQLLAWVLVTPYRDSIDTLLEHEPSFRVLQIPDLLELSVDGMDENYEFVNLDDGEISPYLTHALLSVYDDQYPERQKLSRLQTLIDLGRVFLEGKPPETSTDPIVTLLANNMILEAEFQHERGTLRYARELLVTQELNTTYSRLALLNVFLNDLYFGNQAYGINAAANWYFDKDPTEINALEAAFLIGISENPPRYDPGIDVDGAFSQMERVFALMRDVECIDMSELRFAETFCINEDSTVDLEDGTYQLFTEGSNGSLGGIVALFQAQIASQQYESRTFALAAPHLVNLIERELFELYGGQRFYTEALRVTTAFNPDIQTQAERATQELVNIYTTNGVNNAAFLATNPQNGAIIALVGSIDPTDSYTGNAAFDWREAGSIMHPVTYLAAMTPDEDGGYSYPGTIVWDTPQAYDLGDGNTYTPFNFDGRYRGPISLRNALANSLNVPAVRIVADKGLPEFTEVIEAIGFELEPDVEVSLPFAVGANRVRLIDITTAYGTLANGGVVVSPHAIVAITDRSGQEIYRAETETIGSVSPQNAYLITSILSDPVATLPLFGTGLQSILNQYPQRSVAIKTGTTQDGRGGLWTVGYSSDIVGTMWMGDSDGNQLTGNLTGLRVAQGWDAIMRVAFEEFPPQPFVPPSGLLQYNICTADGTLVTNVIDSSCPSPIITELASASNPPPQPGQGEILVLQIHEPSGLIANEFCPDNVVERTYLTTNNPFVINWVNSTIGGQAWAASVGITGSVEIPPTDSCYQGMPLDG